MPREGAVGVGLVGLGTVGTALVRLLREHAALVRRRLGAALELRAAADVDLERDRGVSLEGIRLTRDWREVVAAPDVDLVVELVGGTGVAREIVEGAIEAGKRVVTANKALLALHGPALFERAAKAGVAIGFEASVAGTIPILRALREGLAGDRIESVCGIVNGTCNFVLTAMEEHGESFEASLRRAQELGYAEADPTLDVSGGDAMHKLVLLAGLAFGRLVRPEEVPTSGIEDVSPLDIEFAGRLGFRVKLLAVARERGGALEVRVGPALVPRTSLLAQVPGNLNAVEVRGAASGPTLYYGAGAGGRPTAAAVLADLVELAREVRAGAPPRVPPLGVPDPEPARVLGPEETEGEFYLRFEALDRPGVLAKIAGALGARGIGIASVVQLARSASDTVPVVMTTHAAPEGRLREALAELAGIPELGGPAQAMRIERDL